jgi:hypothetical protein
MLPYKNITATSIKVGNYSRAETIQGRKLNRGGNYMRKYGMQEIVKGM